jgi:hypothetical protein
LLLFGLLPAAAALECRPLVAGQPEFDGPAEYGRGLLWEVGKPGAEPNHLFGTIHVSDAEIVALSDPVQAALDGSRLFVMEVVPQADEVMQFAQLMFLDDGRRLPDLMPEAQYRSAVEILADYQLPEEVVAGMRPWAAYLTMSYPPNQTQVLDLQLLAMATESGMATHGLESLTEQGSIFADLPEDDQLRLLLDTVCHYDIVRGDFEALKKFYMAEDLKGLILYAQRHAFRDNSLYDRLTERLLTERNRLMAERAAPLLAEGGAFVAVGAMHLPGKHGLLALLKERGYTVQRVH